MNQSTKPAAPCEPFLSSGPCAKRPGMDLRAPNDGPSGARNAPRNRQGKLAQAIALTREVCRFPDDTRIGIVPPPIPATLRWPCGTMLGARGVDMVAWESFGECWVTDAIKQLKLRRCAVIKAE